jgi:uncharacterized protein (TIGR02996 family)
MTTHPEEAALLRSVAEEPADLDRWLVLADWLDEHTDPRGELMRLHVALRACEPGTDNPEVRRQEERLRELLAAGVRPCVPRFTNRIGMEFVLIPPGRFLMGSPTRQKGRRADE